MAKLEQTHIYRSSAQPDELITTLSSLTEPTAWPFPVVFKLSGGGVVSQIMQPPKTEKPFFGEASEQRIRFALVTFGKEVTHFQPIVRLQITPDETGSAIQVALRPHPKAKTFASLFGLGGLLLLSAAIPALLQGEMVGLIAVGFGLLCIGFPNLRARISFDSDCEQTLQALDRALPIKKDTPFAENS